MSKPVVQRAGLRLLAIAFAFMMLRLPAWGATTYPTVLPEGLVTNGVVHAMAKSGSTLYLGGEFDYIGPDTGHAATIDYLGNISGTIPKVDGNIYTAIVDGSGGWIIGGSFTKVGTATRLRLAHIKADGTLDAAWHPDPDGAVYALKLIGTTLFVGGEYNHIGTLERHNVAAVSMTSGNVSAFWDPSPNDRVRTIEFANSTVFLGGEFSTIQGTTTRKYLAAVNTTDARR